MSNNWFVYKNQEQKGPYSLEEIKEKIKLGEFRNTDLYWHETLGDWKPGNQVSTLFDTTGSPPPAKGKLRKSKVKRNPGILKKIVVIVLIVAIIGGGAFAVSRLLGGIKEVLPFLNGSTDFTYFDESYLRQAVNVPFEELSGTYVGVAKYTKAENIEAVIELFYEEDIEYLEARLGKELVAILEATNTYIDVYSMLPGETQDYEDTLNESVYNNGIFYETESYSNDGYEGHFTIEAVVLNGQNDYRIVGYYEMVFKNPEGEEAIVAMEFDAERGE